MDNIRNNALVGKQIYQQIEDEEWNITFQTTQNR